MNTKKPLDAAFDFRGDASFAELVTEFTLDGCEEVLAFFPAGLDGIVNLLVADRIEITEAQVF